MAELHEVLTDEDAYQQILAQLAEHDAYQQRYVARRVRIALEHQRKVAAWQQEYEQALRAGTDPPPRPADPPAEPDLGNTLTSQAGQLREQYRQTLRQLAPVVRSRALERERELIGEWFRTPPASHAGIQEELNRLALTMREVEGDSAIHRGEVTPVDVAVVAGGRLDHLDVPLRQVYSDDAGRMRSLLYLPRYTPSITRRPDPGYVEPPPPSYSKEVDELLRGMRTRKLSDRDLESREVVGRMTGK